MSHNRRTVSNSDNGEAQPLRRRVRARQGHSSPGVYARAFLDPDGTAYVNVYIDGSECLRRNTPFSGVSMKSARRYVSAFNAIRSEYEAAMSRKDSPND